MVARMTARMMARAVSCGAGARFVFISIFSRSVPAAASTLVLLREPGLQRPEVVDDRGSVHLPRARQLLERIGPGLARAERQHLGVLLARFLIAEDRALVERALEAGGVAQRLVELELQDEREKITRVRRVAGDVVLRARIEILFRARDRRLDALVLAAQLPPRLVVVGGLDAPIEDAPAPFVDELAEGEERDLVERHLHLLVDDGFLRRLHRAHEPDLV